ncbi:MAG: hypothetical protein ACLR23_07565 [Clostridia bacterium]
MAEKTRWIDKSALKAYFLAWGNFILNVDFLTLAKFTERILPSYPVGGGVISLPSIR